MTARIDLARLAKLAAEATPGPWWANTTSHFVVDDQPERVAFVDFDKDVEFIAALNPATVTALVEAVQAAQIAVPISCCDQDICPDPIHGKCQHGERCARIEALEALAPFRGDA